MDGIKFDMEEAKAYIQYDDDNDYDYIINYPIFEVRYENLKEKIIDDFLKEHGEDLAHLKKIQLEKKKKSLEKKRVKENTALLFSIKHYLQKGHSAREIANHLLTDQETIEAYIAVLK